MAVSKTNIRSTLYFLWKMIQPKKWQFFSIFALSLVWALDVTVWPYLLRSMLNTLISFEDDRAMAWGILQKFLLCAMAFWVIVEGGFRGKSFMQAKVFPSLEAKIRMKAFDHVQNHSPRYFTSTFSGNLAAQIHDLAVQSTVALESLLIFFPVLITCIVTIVIFFYIHSVFAWIISIWVAAYLALCSLFAAKCSTLAKKHGEARNSLAGKILDSIANSLSVNLFYRFDFEKKLARLSQQEEQKRHSQAKTYAAWVFAGCSLLFLCSMLSITWSIIQYWIQGTITVGEIVQVFNTTWNISLALWFFNEFVPPFLQAMGLISQAHQIFSDPKDIVDSPHAQSLRITKGDIVFENVSFCYGEKKVFSHQNVHIYGGQKVGLVGNSGAGKSTFVNLILRFYSIEEGSISIDGQNIAHTTYASMRQAITLVPQDPPLFHRSLRENILYGKLDASEEEFLSAVKNTHCMEFALRFPEGFDKVVGEKGSKLSGGERQRIAIARAMLANAPILILDEATSSLDSITESYIQESLQILMQNKTTLVIAHRLSTLAQMDRILVFDQGEIIEDGSHNELLAKQGHYARMWHKQAGGFLPL